jgi:Polysaccharide pyruvyl transferase/Sulfotransferase family
MQIIILGMHRSGTSSIAGMFKQMGAAFGSEDLGFPLHPTNPKGFFERMDVVRLNDTVLGSAGANWIMTESFPYDHDINVNVLPYYEQARTIIRDLNTEQDWFIKDPRMCLTLPFWRPLLQSPIYIIVNRNPLSVARSLLRRGDCSISEGMALWERYTRNMLAYTRGHKRLLVQFESMMTNPEGEYRRLMDWIGQQSTHNLRALSAIDLQSWFQHDLVHHQPDPDEIREYASHPVVDLFERLSRDSNLELNYDVCLSAGSRDLLLSFERDYRITTRLRNLNRYWKIRMLNEASRECKRVHDHRLEVEALRQSWRWKATLGILEATPLKARRDREGFSIQSLRDQAKHTSLYLEQLNELISMRSPDLSYGISEFPHEQPSDFRTRGHVRPLRVLMSELGNDASGDEAIYLAASRRLLDAGHTVDWLVRVSQISGLQSSGFPIREIFLPIEQQFLPEIDSASGLLDYARQHLPGTVNTITKLLQDYDVLLIAPGGRFMDGYCNRRALLATVVAQALNKPVIMLNQSFGPFSDKRDRSLMGEVLSNCELVMVRDEISMSLLKQLHVPESKLTMTRDLIFAEKYDPTPDVEYDLGLNFRFGFNGHTTAEGLEQLIISYRSKYPAHRLLLYTTTHSLSSDLLNMAEKHGVDAEPMQARHPDFLHHAARCSLNLTDSYHGALFSVLSNRPFISCQPDFQSHKFQGTSIPGQLMIEPLECPTNINQVHHIMAAIHRHYSDPAELNAHLSTLRLYGNQLVESGWEQVDVTLCRLANRLND